MINIEPFKKYTRKDIQTLLEFTDAQLKAAEQKKLIVMFDGTMYGISFFQFLKQNHLELEKIKNV